MSKYNPSPNTTKGLLSFGRYKDTALYHVPTDYLVWLCASYKGAFRARHAGEKPFCPPMDDFILSRTELERRGYDTKGVWPTKDYGRKTINDLEVKYGQG